MPIGSVQEVVSALTQDDNFVVVAHISPDPDAVGSSVALVRALRRLGKEAVVYLRDPVPVRMREVVGDFSVLSEPPLSDSATKPFTLVAVDTATEQRIGERYKELFERAKRVINIDHHISNTGWGDVAHINESRSSASEIVYEIITAFHGGPDQGEASLLYAGLCDDTSCFRNGNTTEHSFHCAAQLVKAGATPALIASSLYFSQSIPSMKLRATILGSMTLHFDNRAVCAALTTEMMQACGGGNEDADGVIEDLRAIAGVQICVFMKQLQSGWKLSLRSRTAQYDVNAIAGHFGGGGHRQASGCTVQGSEEEARAAVLPLVEKALLGG